ncbi:hypothetical protein GDO86_015537 [Hymenochirus boettgeri]|uniref:Nanos-type domain-containing protein n=1 Tax=Hymenochirus boettgeri TaxID=247094 RepID=A0A8T2JXT1_9PIPI|nr:hypothetical protein GDO86_015537 [Hymenochirus boettgeri]
MEFQPWKDYFQLAWWSRKWPWRGGRDMSTSQFSRDLFLLSAQALHLWKTAAVGRLQDADIEISQNDFYNSHTLKNQQGIIICPVLRKYICPLCGATGDTSHTLKICPFNRRNTRPLQKEWTQL